MLYLYKQRGQTPVSSEQSLLFEDEESRACALDSY